MVTRRVRNYEVKANSKAEVDAIEKHMTNEDYLSEDFKKYFHVWLRKNVGVYYFIKEKYFVSRGNVTNYAIALLEYGASMIDLLES